MKNLYYAGLFIFSVNTCNASQSNPGNSSQNILSDPKDKQIAALQELLRVKEQQIATLKKEVDALKAQTSAQPKVGGTAVSPENWYGYHD